MKSGTPPEPAPHPGWAAFWQEAFRLRALLAERRAERQGTPRDHGDAPPPTG